MNIADMLKNPIDLSEVQDFSMGKKSSDLTGSAGASGLSGKGKLNDTLSKLMKKNNVVIEEPAQQPLSKEKKRRKLDEIVMGLSAAKTEQKSIFGDPGLSTSSASHSTKKPQITPSVSVTPANVPSSSSQQMNQSQKPFTITVTSVPGTRKNSESCSISIYCLLFSFWRFSIGAY